jgi:hypothetical protein
MVLPFATTEATETLVSQPSDDPINSWLDRVTRRLSADRDLQLEVRQELRSHLEESIAEFRDAGRGASDARDEALRALGDESELADGLWRANRRRMRVRSLVAWMAGLALPPIVVAMIVFLVGGALLTVAFARPEVFGFNLSQRDGSRGADHRAAFVAQASPVAQKLLEQDHPDADRLEIARLLVENNPSDPALYANYAYVASTQRFFLFGKDAPADPAAPAQPNRPVLERTLALLAEGERREPGNALYPGIAAAVLFDVSAEVTQTTQPDGTSLDWDDPRGWDREVVTDPALHAQAVAAAGRALAAPYLRTYDLELIDRRMERASPSRVGDVWLLEELEEGATRHWTREFRSAAEHLEAMAIDAARANKRDDAERIIRDLRLYAGKAAVGARCSSDVDHAVSLRQSTDWAENRVQAIVLGKDQAREQRGRLQVDARALFQPVGDRHKWLKEHQAEMPLFLGGWGDRSLDLDPAPMRQAEYAVVDQFGAGIISAGLLLGAALYAAAAGVQWLRARRKGASPPRLFIGWRRTAWVVGAGAIAPMVLFVLYTRLTPISGRSHGLSETAALQRVLLEYLAMALIVLALVSTFARRAIIGRMIELGTATKPMTSKRRIGDVVLFSGAILAVACLMIALLLGSGLFDSIPDHIERRMDEPALIAAWLLLILVGATYWKRQRSSEIANTPPLIFSGVVARSAFPLVLIAALAVALMGVPHYLLEAEHVRAFVGEPAKRLTVTPVGEQGYGLVREGMIREYERDKQAALR